MEQSGLAEDQMSGPQCAKVSGRASEKGDEGGGGGGGEGLHLLLTVLDAVEVTMFGGQGSVFHV